MAPDDQLQQAVATGSMGAPGKNANRIGVDEGDIGRIPDHHLFPWLITIALTMGCAGVIGFVLALLP